jgi:mRNA interferase ChpB
MKRGDIYLVDLEPTAGHEQRGHRPVLIVSSEAFNRLTGCPVVLPITNGGGFARRVGFAVPISGIPTTGIVRCDQPRSLDLSARSGRKVDTLPPSIMEEVLATAVTIFE